MTLQPANVITGKHAASKWKASPKTASTITINSPIALIDPWLRDSGERSRSACRSLAAIDPRPWANHGMLSETLDRW
jgi:hypothetical protein